MFCRTVLLVSTIYVLLMQFRLYLVKIELKILKLVLVVNNARFKSTLCIIILSNGLAWIYFKTHVLDNVLYIWLFMDINFLIRY